MYIVHLFYATFLFEDIIQKSQDNLRNEKKMIKFVMKKTWNTSPYTGLAITLFRTFFAKVINSIIHFIDKSSIKNVHNKHIS